MQRAGNHRLANRPFRAEIAYRPAQAHAFECAGDVRDRIVPVNLAVGDDIDAGLFLLVQDLIDHCPLICQSGLAVSAGTEPRVATVVLQDEFHAASKCWSIPRHVWRSKLRPALLPCALARFRLPRNYLHAHPAHPCVAAVHRKRAPRERQATPPRPLRISVAW